MNERAAWIALALVVVLGGTSARAQNAAQRSALAQMGSAGPQHAPPSGVDATAIPLNHPNGRVFDAAGKLYIAETNDNQILEVNETGILSVVAGTGQQGFTGDGGAGLAAGSAGLVLTTTVADATAIFVP